MQNSGSFFFTFFLLLLLISGCAGGTPFLFKAPFKPNPDFVRNIISEDIASIKKFNGNATLTVDTPEQSGKVQGRVVISPAKEAQIDLHHPFGGALGTLEFKNNYLVFYDAQGNIQFIGTSQQTGIPGLPRLISGDQDIINVLLGLINLPDTTRSTLVKDTLAEKSYFLEYRSALTNQKYWVNPDLRKITKYSEIDLETGLETEIEFSNFDNIQGINIPKLITVTQPEAKRLFSVYYHNLDILISSKKYTS